ncbi:metallophosphoesterase [Thermomonas sp.]|uniref:metallophosphoesterase n=1 Tax=Thermomonas sp. TaxID=1971895 RepID=UPI002486EAFF|nr:metallophosphoesterase [Thermomonas sp.]MDI1252998.1 metallophosphoesterase [Thermomonas sp.]
MAIDVDETKPDILICHLSDLHIRTAESIALSRMSDISGAIGSLVTRPTAVLFLVSGDLAFSGKAEEYDLATTALEKLKQSLKAWPVESSHVYVSPGNHDCDFSKISTTVQSALINDIPEVAGLETDSIIGELSRTQVDFTLFRDVVCSPMQAHGSILSRTRIDLNGRSIAIYAINTAWTSKNPETPGALRMPKDVLPNDMDEADLAIAIAHHPLNWFSPQDARYLSHWLDTHVDMTFWGHEHAIDDFEQIRGKFGSKVKHLIALPIDDRESECGFSCLKISATEGGLQKTDFHWSGAELRLKSEHIGEICPMNPARLLGKIRFTSTFEDFLDDPGAFLKHPQLSRHLRLSEVYVHPEFRTVDSAKSESVKLTSSVTTSDLIDASTAFGKVIVFGQEQSGKTTFAKTLVSELRHNGSIPIYLDFATLSSANRGEIKTWFRSALSAQYERDAHDEISQLESKRRFVVLDNLQSAPAGSTGIARVFELVTAWADRIISLTSASPAITVLSAEIEGDQDSAYWRGSKIFEILPLSHKRRGELIRKWVEIGRSDSITPEQIEHETRQVKSVIDAWLGKNFLPRFPVFVLIVLQQMDVGRQLKSVISNGSQGFLFEALITKAIEGHVHKHPINTVRDFLSEFAAALWVKDAAYLSTADVASLREKFAARLVTVSSDILLEELVEARLIAVDARGMAFRYPYLYYYFSALWISRLKDVERDIEIRRHVEFVNTERSANILTFLAHLEKHHEVLKVLLPMASSLYSESTQGTLSEYSKISVRYRTAADRQTLMLGKPDQVSDYMHDERDRMDGMIEGREDVGNGSQLEDTFKLNTAIKSIQVLGQILKSRASGFEADEKVLIASESMKLTRRMLSFFYKIIYENADMFVHFASDAFERALKIDKTEAANIANDFIGLLVVGFGKVSISIVGEALASPELPLLISRLEKDAADDEDSRLMLLAARLIADPEYPSHAVIEFNSGLKPANVLAHSILGWLVARRFHLDPPDHAVRDQACKLLGIETKRLPARLVGAGGKS